ncbi:PLDc N-terminal domain-containing protein [Chromatocurvus halotolerans]|uniref:Phospholipase D-like protein n=1 Tax=Chromatocurvus halotolerans TaxID=1132028 RepID=A0A4R2KZD9_9GAMM|nr:PLDc N-terminal domain-containing protein [Chromatocurvus halotolerans]TCO78287.1 phospholipase D-like protein [Chromatocurvus halotolerans]
MGIETGGFLGLIWLAIAIYAIIKTVQSSAGTGAKVIWTLVILVLPVFGLLAWFIFGPKG